MKRPNNHLYLVKGGARPRVEGPVTRLGLRQNFQPLSKKHITLLFLPKLILLGLILYFLIRH
ncbi:MAG: hypothetical protein H6617_08985 [Bdellovibrionaceae bacterium]|nr:hypothetical protein [Bdellovibrionales bacterium]MCB9254802.1 hypothetical protein [Pseudobdellovibrionaceae bacterium]